MMSSWRLKQPRIDKNKNKHLSDHEQQLSSCMELTIPNHFRCPISLDLMKDPVTLSTGITYDRDSIDTWIQSGNNTCPTTNQALTTRDDLPVPNHTLRKMIQDWCVEKHSFGIERIPTPRTPLDSILVSKILSKINVACDRKDRITCEELVVKVKNLAKESERNKRCIVENRTANVLAHAFESFSKVSLEENDSVLEEILSVLAWIINDDDEAKSYLGSSNSSMQCMVWFLNYGNLSPRKNAISVLREVIYHDQTKVVQLNKIQGAKEALAKLVREPICPAATCASLMVMFYMVISSSLNTNKIIQDFVELGLVSSLVESLIDSDRGTCEKTLAMLDKICTSKVGREKAYESALMIPVLVKKILRVSDTGTELSVSVLWRLCKNEERKEGVLVEAVQVGAFQKVLLVLQVGCAKRTKEKASELLKLLNPYRAEFECVESMEFNHLKRSF